MLSVNPKGGINSYSIHGTDALGLGQPLVNAGDVEIVEAVGDYSDGLSNLVVLVANNTSSIIF